MCSDLEPILRSKLSPIKHCSSKVVFTKIGPFEIAIISKIFIFLLVWECNIDYYIPPPKKKNQNIFIEHVVSRIDHMYVYFVSLSAYNTC